MISQSELGKLIEAARRKGAIIRTQGSVDVSIGQPVTAVMVRSGIPGVGQGWMPVIEAAERLREFIRPLYHCNTCGRDNEFVNQCGCDPNNMPTKAGLTAAQESDKKSLERDLFGEDPDSVLNDNQYRAIRCIIDERDALEADAAQAHHVLDILEIPRECADKSTLTLLGRMRIVQDRRRSWELAAGKEITGIRLSRNRRDAVVLIEVDGQWAELIREPFDACFDHIVNEGGIIKVARDAHIASVLSAVLPIARAFAAENPIWSCVPHGSQDPCGVHAFLERFDNQRQQAGA